ncbi:monooxygenase [Curtobacterium sp. MCBD17_034]|uniref:flavin-containing monooxygenase n=1 Tax=unclassified Curtobacterium TaxID=257496 RepID=UPI000DA89A19|nr:MULTISPECIES: NAD(P)/FAD-dependent oxidoreductase [unclassified Curtobacterium]PZF55353.1 monooxygenase [Curtobacterium sp. MCBD17_034]PZM32819.1 monooxygenase [Curtobacterium sp. MCBD17_031]WIB63560.1 NAD(P)/FAD-dependent oxidoreductase [Curtobacterium sp. MCBD17_040]
MTDIATDSSMREADLEALRARYRVERDRRIRPDGLRQYQGMRGAYGYWATDPYTRRSDRPAKTDRVEVLIVGGGFGGLLTGARLRQAGFTDIRMTEEGGDFGGTWYWNRYPGIHCDIEASVYMPLLEEVGTVPTRRYAPGEEIRRHAMAMARHFDLYDDVLFHTRVTDLRWDDDTADWAVRTDRGDTMRARYVIVSSGSLSQPKLPAIPGMENFRGHTFHTSRWDYGYTGGDQAGGMTGLADKRVAVVGTGATGIQVIPLVAEDAAHLTVFQRTPSSVDVRDNRDLPADWTTGLPTGWQQERMENFLAVVSGEETEVDLIQDGWTSTAALQRTMLTGQTEDTLDPEERDRLIEIADARKMDQIRARVDAVVTDPATAEILKPWYRYMCKRPTFSDKYLQAFNRPNVTLVDTADTGGITAMTETGVVVGDTEYEVDAVVFATGFETGVSGVISGTLPVHGRDGTQLLEAWARGPRTLHGFVSHGFPNLFHLGALQNANSVNFVHILQEQATHIAAILEHARDDGARQVEPTVEAEDRWLATIHEVEVDNAAFLAECTPGYYNGEGTRKRGGGGYSPGPVRFHRLLREWRQTSIDEVLVPELAVTNS